jgi:transposase-like protein
MRLSKNEIDTSTLSLSLKRVIRLFVLEQRSVSQIAKILRVSESVVRGQLLCARVVLKRSQVRPP